jgi:hypothetical protein
MRIDVEVTAEDRARLEAVFGTTADLDALIKIIASAGARELLGQATGRAVFSSISDLRHFRIYCLLASGLNLSQAEALVPRLFKVPAGSARRHVEATLARYDVELQDRVHARVRDVLDAARWRDDAWAIELPAGSVRDTVLAVTDELTVADPHRIGMGRLWSFPRETYAAVCKHFGIAAKDKPK